MKNVEIVFVLLSLVLGIYIIYAIIITLKSINEDAPIKNNTSIESELSSEFLKTSKYFNEPVESEVELMYLAIECFHKI